MKSLLAQRGDSMKVCAQVYKRVQQVYKETQSGTEKASPGGTGRVLRTGSPREKVI